MDEIIPILDSEKKLNLWFETIKEDLKIVVNLEHFFKKILKKTENIRWDFKQKEMELEDAKKQIELLFKEIEIEYKYLEKRWKL